MRLRALAVVLVAVLPLVAPATAAQLYKWVDERGVTNYSSEPPADPGAAKKLLPVEGNLSVYSPDPALKRSTETDRRDGNRALEARIASLERQLEVERLARQYAAAAAAPVSCRSGFDCYGTVADYYPVSHVVSYVPVRRRHRPLVQAQLPPGAIAGNVVGMSGYIPGQSAVAAALAPPRRLRHPRAIDQRRLEKCDRLPGIPFLVVVVDGDGFALFDGKRFQITALNHLIELGQIDVRVAAASRVDELVEQKCPRDDQEPKNDLSSSRTQIH